MDILSSFFFLSSAFLLLLSSQFAGHPLPSHSSSPLTPIFMQIRLCRLMNRPSHWAVKLAMIKREEFREVSFRIPIPLDLSWLVVFKPISKNESAISAVLVK